MATLSAGKFQPNVYKDKNGNRLVADNGGFIHVFSGGSLKTDSGALVGIGGATPVAVPIAGASQAAVTDTDLTTLVDSTGGTASTTFAAITAGATYAQADMVAVKNALSETVVALNKAQVDIVALTTLCNSLRSSLVSLGYIKGSA